MDSNARRPLHVVFGSGGTKAILAGTGAVLAFRVAGLTEWKSIGSASGGSIPALLLASGAQPADFLRQVIETDFDRLLVPRTSFLGRMYALMRKYYYDKTRPSKGAYGTDLFKHFIDSLPLVRSWPDAFWTTAVCEHGQIVFTKNGVFKYAYAPGCKGQVTDQVQKIADAPPSLGLAVCATCAIPGILDAVHYHDEYLFDGALSNDGDTPINVAFRHFGARKEDVIAIDMGEESIKKKWWLRLLWWIGCWGDCGPIEGIHPTADDAKLVITPEITGFHALEFTLSRNLKWRAVVSGYVATAQALATTDLISEEDKRKVLRFGEELQECVARHDKHLSCRIEAFLAKHDMYTPPECVR